MQPNFLDQPLSALSHAELLRKLVAAPCHPTLSNEFKSRYNDAIRQAIAQAVYKKMLAVPYDVMQMLIEESVSETYFRLFQNNCQALRAFKGMHENSIFAYLRRISCNTARNNIRLYWRQHAYGRLQPLETREESPQEFGAEREEALHCCETPAVEQQSLEQLLRASLRLGFRDTNANRNFIIFKLHFVHGYHAHEMAQIKGLELGERGIGNTADRMRQWLRQGHSPGREEKINRRWLREEFASC